jgi:hypothetical protein
MIGKVSAWLDAWLFWFLIVWCVALPLAWELGG